MHLLGLDIGSSSVKASMVNADNGKVIASAFYPEKEMEMTAHQAGWAEQQPKVWWENMKMAIKKTMERSAIRPEEIKGIGISYQMHGLVAVDKNREVIRPSIIWCDSRAVEIGDQAFKKIGQEKCLSHLLNSPGNFTASKLKWVKENEPANFERIDKIMLPGDYIAMRLTGECNTTISGLSEGIFWDFKSNDIAKFLLDHYGIPLSFIPEIVPTFTEQGKVSADIAKELGLAAGTPIAYRAGDQPNNAFSLNVLNPGELAATAGTSGVVYGVSDEVKYDPKSRVNTFAHVNHTQEINRLGVLLCVNGTGILNSWLKHNIGNGSLDYEEMNKQAASIPIGSEGLMVLPFGNGAERMLGNQDTGAYFAHTNFNIHQAAHLFRASQEGIVFSFNYGIEVMKQTGIDASVIRAGQANMFLSPIFRDTLAGITGATIELYDTDGAAGAAKGAGVGTGYYKSFKEAFANLQLLQKIEPDNKNKNAYREAYEKWNEELNTIVKS